MKRGPYRLIRHPFYTSYLLAWATGLAATHEPTLLLPLALMTTIYLRAAAQEEAKFMRSELAREYAIYRATTGLFLPGL